MFSLTFIAVVIASRGFDPIIVGLGRVLLLAPAAVITLRLGRKSLFPARKDLGLVLLVAAGVVVLYPALTTFALGQVSVSASGVIASILPILSSVFAIYLGHGRPKLQFWIAASVGMLATVAFALTKDANLVAAPLAGLALFASMFAAGIGNVAGATLGRENKSYHVISWGIILSLPLTLTATLLDIWLSPGHGLTAEAYASGSIPFEAWIGFAYAALISSFGAHFFWFRGLHEVGVVRGSQLQLAQAPITLIWGIVLLGQIPTLLTWMAAGVVLACVAWSQRAK
jgi:drug/metabolite transporter (DMT)-like permease